MGALKLSEFIIVHRDELIRRCRIKVGTRSTPPPAETQICYGVPLFLDQLVGELRQEGSRTQELRASAFEHGHELLLAGMTMDGVVHDYGDVCQAITELAIEIGGSIATEDFRTLNRCLDNAIAGAATRYAHEQGMSRTGDRELRSLACTAMMALEMLKSGFGGPSGSTGDVLSQSLVGIMALVDRPLAADR
jgi:hypothetical protein